MPPPVVAAAGALEWLVVMATEVEAVTMGPSSCDNEELLAEDDTRKSFFFDSPPSSL